MSARIATAVALALGLVIVSAPLLAHHGGSEYDTKNPLTLKGTVTEFNWSNPHCQILLDVKQDDGKVVNWSFETLAPAVLKRAGWSPQSMHRGDQVTITFAPSKRGTPVGTLRKAVLADGKELTGGYIGEQEQPNQ
jgi:Family of unknown function (DUF6152)